MSTANIAPARQPKPSRGATALRTLLTGRGQPRLRLGAALAAAFWGGLIWLVYPYALGIASWETNARFLGLALLLLVAFAAYKLVQNIGRIVWHLGLLWLGAILLAVFVGATAARARASGAADWPSWQGAASQVASGASARIGQFVEGIAAAPTDISMAATGSAPFWRSPPAAYAEPAVLGRRAEAEQVVLSSEQEPTGITRGVIAMAVSDDGTAINLRAAPGTDAAIVGKLDSGSLLFVTGGPRRAGEQIWWQVSDQEREGWCSAELLTLVSR